MNSSKPSERAQQETSEINLKFQNLSVSQSGRPVDSNRKPNHNSIPIRRQNVLKWNGWGYKDSAFIADEDQNVYFSGERYKLGSGNRLPNFLELATSMIGFNVTDKHEKRPPPTLSDYPKAILNNDFLKTIEESVIMFSLDGEDRLFRAHGHTLAELFILRNGMFKRIPDLVVWPESHAQVEFLVPLAEKHGVVIIPFGGGTSVTGALLCSENENRMIVSLDTSQMSKILWINEQNLTACIEAGIIGQDLERTIKEKGFTVGHEPDSYEFSSLGGWVATRASGMKKNNYGNIEDLVVQLKCVTPRGVVEKYAAGPRISAGPDVHQMIMGSEGTFGVITEVTLKIRPIPVVQHYGSLVFPDFESGVAFMREVALKRCQPASIRLVDNEQFHFSYAFKPESSLYGWLSDTIKKIYLTKVKGFDDNKLCAVTLLFEGCQSEVEAQESKINEMCYRHGGLPAGATNGERGFMLTFVIAYIRDFGFDHGVIAESFETAVPWDKVAKLCHNVKHRIRMECKSRGIEKLLISCRVSQTYDAGACVYFYFAFNHSGIENSVHIYEEIENNVRDEVLESGGNVSHHHGIGKIRKHFMHKTLTPAGLDAVKALKNYFDPTNIFGSGNLVD